MPRPPAASVEAQRQAAAAAVAAAAPPRLVPEGDWGVVLPVVLQDAPAAPGQWCVVLHSSRQHSISVESLLENRVAQPWVQHNVALKCLRDWQEEEHPQGGHVEDLSFAPILEIKAIVHPKGMDYHWDHAAETTQWDWRGFLAHLQPDMLRDIVGDGLVALALANTPDSYDHKRHHAARAGERPQRIQKTIWDFIAVRSDGSAVAFHPDYKGKKMGVRPFNAQAARDPPRTGLGGTEGPGTFRRFLRENYPQELKNVEHCPASGAAPVGGASGAAAPAPAVAGPAAAASAPAVAGPAAFASAPPPPPG